jgi:hypothetical protein
METRTAPQWIRDREKSYRRARWMWVCATALGWLGWAGWWTYFMLRPPNTALWNVVAGLCLVGWVALDHLKLEEHATRYRAAADALNSPIARYEVSQDLSESMLGGADRRAREALHTERIRTAPAWIRDKRRGYRLRILGWFAPAPAAWAAVSMGWRWVRPWQILSAGLVLLIGAVFKTRKLRTAAGRLSEAIGRYEFESAATESDLDEAGRRASEVLQSGQKTA